jgi:hypothetical protein
LKPERWGSPLVQGKYQEEKACDKRHPYRIIIIIIIIIGNFVLLTDGRLFTARTKSLFLPQNSGSSKITKCSEKHGEF